MAPKLRVCHVITQLELGGAQRNTLYTVSHLDRERFDPSLICGRGGLLDTEATAGQWTTIFLRSLVRPIHPFKDISAVISLYQAFRRQKPHIVHTHSSKAGILGRIAAYLAGVPVILHTFHGFGFTPAQNQRIRNLYVRLEKFCARLSTHLAFVSQDNQREAEELGIVGKIPYTLIRSGITMNSERMPIAFPEGIPYDAWVVASVGNFKPQKNPTDLLDVAAHVIEKDPNVHFLLIGDGELREACQAEAIERKLSHHVHFLGWRQDARRLVAESKAFLLTSLWEGLPRALVEAFAEMKPAVAYAVNGVNDILINQETGFAITPGDTAAVADRLLWLKNNPLEAHRMGVNGRRRVELEFDIDRMVRDQESLYEKLYAAVPLKEYYEKLWEPETSHS